MPKVLVTARSFRKMQGDHWRVLQEAGFEIVTPEQDQPLKEAEMIPLIGEVDAALVGNDAVTERVIAAAPCLKVVSKHGVGVDNVDVPAATRAGVIVTNTPGANQVAVAEMAVALIMALTRKLAYHDTVVKSGGWSRIIGTELEGKTVGLVGLGRIGKEVVLRLKGFRVKFLAYDVYQDNAFAAEHGVRFVALDELLAESDVVTLHAVLTADTQRFMGEKELARMKPGAYLVNTARGGLVDEQALYRALAENRLAGAGLDVFAEEPPTNSPLLQLGDKVLLTPHLGAQTTETVLRMGKMAAENIVRVLRGERPVGLVNPDAYSKVTERRL
ncbi:MAG: phosphoglycerate dehydrogenase [Chloroflexi bacterium]|nr:phosphoglycerate dehydrogenase [Chloroflexota bacterium]